MAVVCEQKIGETVVRIHDDSYRNISPEAVQRILKRIADDVFPALIASEKEKAAT